MKRFLFAVAATFFCAAVSAEEGLKQTDDPFLLSGAPLQPAVAPESSDLAFDTGFGSPAGMTYLEYYTPGLYDAGLRVASFSEQIGTAFPLELATRHYLAGKLRYNNLWYAGVAKMEANGSFHSSFGSGGKVRQPTELYQLVDAVFKPSTGPLLFRPPSRAYFIGTKKWSGTFIDEDYAVFCLDLSTYAACSGFGNGGFVWINFDLGGSKNDVAARAVLDGDNLIIAGAVDSPSGSQIGLASVNATSGARTPGFGTNGMAHLRLPTNGVAVEQVWVFDMALSDAAAPGGKRLYVVGKNRFNADTDGYVQAFDPQSGAAIASFGSGGYIGIYHEADNPSADMDDSATAVAVQRNGKVVVAGQSAFATGPIVIGNGALILARFSITGRMDLGDCYGSRSTACPLGGGRTNVYPSAIAQRAMTGDIVIALQETMGLVPVQLQGVEQWSASGATLHAANVMNYSAQPGTTAQGWTAGMEVFSDTVLVAGTRFWAGDDFDATLSKFTAKDSIFANQFGDVHGD